MEALARALATKSAAIGAAEINTLREIVSPILNNESPDRVAALASAHGAALLALTKQCITAVSDAATPPASVATLLECALLCVRAVFKLRARLTCPPLSLEAFLRRILVDAYTKRLFGIGARAGAALLLRVCEHSWPHGVVASSNSSANPASAPQSSTPMPSWDALHISVDADPIAFDWNRVAQWLSPPALPSSSSASASAPKAAATTTPAPGAFDWTPVASLLVPSLLAFITCVAETKGSEAAFGAVQSLVDGMAVPWAVYLEQSTSGSAAKPATTAPAASNHNNTDADAWSNFSVKQLDTLGKLKFKTTVQWHALTAATASAASVTVVQLQQRMRLARRRFDAITLVLCASVTAPDLAFVLPQLYASLAYANKATAELCAVSSASAVTVQADTDANANANTDAVSDWLLAALRLAKIWRARLAVSPSSSASPVSASLSASAECAMFLLQVGAAARQHLPPRHSTVECITMSLTDLCQTMGDSGTAISALHECVTLLATSCASSSAINIAPPSTAVGQKTASAAARRVAVALPSDTNTSPSIISVETVVDSVRTVGARVRAMVSAASAASPEARGQCASTVQLVVPLLQETVALLNKRLKLPDISNVDASQLRLAVEICSLLIYQCLSHCLASLVPTPPVVSVPASSATVSAASATASPPTFTSCFADAASLRQQCSHSLIAAARVLVASASSSLSSSSDSINGVGPFVSDAQFPAARADFNSLRASAEMHTIGDIVSSKASAAAAVDSCCGDLTRPIDASSQTVATLCPWLRCMRYVACASQMNSTPTLSTSSSASSITTSSISDSLANVAFNVALCCYNDGRYAAAALAFVRCASILCPVHVSASASTSARQLTGHPAQHRARSVLVFRTYFYLSHAFLKCEQFALALRAIQLALLECVIPVSLPPAATAATSSSSSSAPSASATLSSSSASAEWSDYLSRAVERFVAIRCALLQRAPLIPPTIVGNSIVHTLATRVLSHGVSAVRPSEACGDCATVAFDLQWSVDIGTELGPCGSEQEQHNQWSRLEWSVVQSASAAPQYTGPVHADHLTAINRIFPAASSPQGSVSAIEFYRWSLLCAEIELLCAESSYSHADGAHIAGGKMHARVWNPQTAIRLSNCLVERAELCRQRPRLASLSPAAMSLVSGDTGSNKSSGPISKTQQRGNRGLSGCPMEDTAAALRVVLPHAIALQPALRAPLRALVPELELELELDSAGVRAADDVVSVFSAVVEAAASALAWRGILALDSADSAANSSSQSLTSSCSVESNASASLHAAMLLWSCALQSAPSTAHTAAERSDEKDHHGGGNQAQRLLDTVLGFALANRSPHHRIGVFAVALRDAMAALTSDDANGSEHTSSASVYWSRLQSELLLDGVDFDDCIANAELHVDATTAVATKANAAPKKTAPKPALKSSAELNSSSSSARSGGDTRRHLFSASSLRDISMVADAFALVGNCAPSHVYALRLSMAVAASMRNSSDAASSPSSPTAHASSSTIPDQTARVNLLLATAFCALRCADAVLSSAVGVAGTSGGMNGGSSECGGMGGEGQGGGNAAGLPLAALPLIAYAQRRLEQIQSERCDNGDIDDNHMDDSTGARASDDESDNSDGSDNESGSADKRGLPAVSTRAPAWLLFQSLRIQSASLLVRAQSAEPVHQSTSSSPASPLSSLATAHRTLRSIVRQLSSTSVHRRHSGGANQDDDENDIGGGSSSTSSSSSSSRQRRSREQTWVLSEAWLALSHVEEGSIGAEAALVAATHALDLRMALATALVAGRVQQQQREQLEEQQKQAEEQRQAQQLQRAGPSDKASKVVSKPSKSAAAAAAKTTSKARSAAKVEPPAVADEMPIVSSAASGAHTAASASSLSASDSGNGDDGDDAKSQWVAFNATGGTGSSAGAGGASAHAAVAAKSAIGATTQAALHEVARTGLLHGTSSHASDEASGSASVSTSATTAVATSSSVAPSKSAKSALAPAPAPALPLASASPSLSALLLAQSAAPLTAVRALAATLLRVAELCDACGDARKADHYLQLGAYLLAPPPATLPSAAALPQSVSSSNQMAAIVGSVSASSIANGAWAHRFRIEIAALTARRRYQSSFRPEPLLTAHSIVDGSRGWATADWSDPRRAGSLAAVAASLGAPSLPLPLPLLPSSDTALAHVPNHGLTDIDACIADGDAALPGEWRQCGVVIADASHDTGTGIGNGTGNGTGSGNGTGVIIDQLRAAVSHWACAAAIIQRLASPAALRALLVGTGDPKDSSSSSSSSDISIGDSSATYLPSASSLVAAFCAPLTHAAARVYPALAIAACRLARRHAALLLRLSASCSNAAAIASISTRGISASSSSSTHGVSASGNATAAAAQSALCVLFDALVVARLAGQHSTQTAKLWDAIAHCLASVAPSTLSLSSSSSIAAGVSTDAVSQSSAWTVGASTAHSIPRASTADASADASTGSAAAVAKSSKTGAAAKPAPSRAKAVAALATAAAKEPPAISESVWLTKTQSLDTLLALISSASSSSSPLSSSPSSSSPSSPFSSIAVDLADAIARARTAAVRAAFRAGSAHLLSPLCVSAAAALGRRRPVAAACMLHCSMAVGARKDAAVHAHQARLADEMKDIGASAIASASASAGASAGTECDEAHRHPSVFSLGHGLDAEFRRFCAHLGSEATDRTATAHSDVDDVAAHAQLPAPLVIVSVSVSADGAHLLVSRTCRGDGAASPLVVALPLTQLSATAVSSPTIHNSAAAAATAVSSSSPSLLSDNAESNESQLAAAMARIDLDDDSNAFNGESTDDPMAVADAPAPAVSLATAVPSVAPKRLRAAPAAVRSAVTCISTSASTCASTSASGRRGTKASAALELPEDPTSAVATTAAAAIVKPKPRTKAVIAAAAAAAATGTTTAASGNSSIESAPPLRAERPRNAVAAAAVSDDEVGMHMGADATMAPLTKVNPLAAKASKTVVAAKSSRGVTSAAATVAATTAPLLSSSSLLPSPSSMSSSASSLERVLSEFDDIMAASHSSTHRGSSSSSSATTTTTSTSNSSTANLNNNQTMSAADRELAERRAWWTERQALDHRLHACLATAEDALFGAWKGLLLGAPRRAAAPHAHRASVEARAAATSVLESIAHNHHQMQRVAAMRALSATPTSSASSYASSNPSLPLSPSPPSLSAPIALSALPDAPALIDALLRSAAAATDSQLRAAVAWLFGFAPRPNAVPSCSANSGVILPMPLSSSSSSSSSAEHTLSAAQCTALDAAVAVLRQHASAIDRAWALDLAASDGTTSAASAAVCTGAASTASRAADGTVEARRLGMRGHVVLVLDKTLQRLPWESCPVFGEHAQSVSRLPSLPMLLARLVSSSSSPSPPARVDPARGFFVLNPSGDLTATQLAFERPFLARGWRGVAGRPPAAADCIAALQSADIYVYCGHSGGERYVRAEALKAATIGAGSSFSGGASSGNPISSASGSISASTSASCSIRGSASTSASSGSGSASATVAADRLPARAHALLIGCSSGLLQHEGRYDATGIALAYLLAGCPTVVANLWDVTDGEIDRYCAALLRHWIGDAPTNPSADASAATSASVSASASGAKKTGSTARGSVVATVASTASSVSSSSSNASVPLASLSAAVQLGRKACNLHYLTGAAPILYGLPENAFYRE